MLETAGLVQVVDLAWHHTGQSTGRHLVASAEQESFQPVGEMDCQQGCWQSKSD